MAKKKGEKKAAESPKGEKAKYKGKKGKGGASRKVKDNKVKGAIFKKNKGKDKQEISKDDLVECFYCDALVSPKAMKCPRCGKWYSTAKKLAVLTILTCTIVIVILFTLQALSDDGHSPWTGVEQRPSFDLDDWSVPEDVTVPEGDPDLTGRMYEQYDTYSFSVQSFELTDEGRPDLDTAVIEYVYLDVNTNVFILDRETNSVTEGTVYDIQSDVKMLRIWGSQNTNGGWDATDITLMTGGGGGGRLPI